MSRIQARLFGGLESRVALELGDDGKLIVTSRRVETGRGIHTNSLFIVSFRSPHQ